MKTVAGIDVGGTSIKGVLMDAGYSVLAKLRKPTPPDADAYALAGAVSGIAAALIARAAAAGAQVAGVGVASAGVVDEEAQVVRWASNLGWDDTPLARLIEDGVGRPVVLLNDARAAARAEGLLGAARGVRDFVLVTLGTGIGGAVVSDGVPRRGAHGLAGEIGHLRVVPDGVPCGCGGVGCLETIASARAVSNRYSRLSAATCVGAEAVVQRASAGDGAAATVWRDAIDALAAALGATVAVVDCELVVIGGGMAAAGPLLLDPLAGALAESVRLAPPPRLVIAELGGLAGALGAAVAVQSRIAGNTTEAVVGGPPG